MEAVKNRKLYCVTHTGAISGSPTCARLHLELMRPFFASAELILEEHGPMEEVCRERGVSCRVMPLLHTGLRTLPRRLDRIVRLGRVARSRVNHVRELARLCSATPCILHVHSIHAPWALLAGCLARVPVVLHVHEQRMPGFERWLEEQTAVRTARRILTVSEAIRKQYGLPFQKKAVTLYNFLEPATEAAVPAGARSDHPPWIIATIGYLGRRKGTDEFIGICRLLRDRQVPFRAWLVGPFDSAESEHRCREKVRTHGLSDVVEFFGLRKDVTALYDQIQVLVHPARRDPLPRVVMEAMGRGVPVVASHVDGLPEMVEDGKTGFLVDPDDLQGFADRICLLLDDAPQRRRMGEAARERASRQFSREHYRDRMLQIYTGLLESEERRD